MNFTSLINQIAKRLPDKLAIIESGEFITYKELWHKTEGLTNSFLELGLEKGDRVAVILPNCKEFIYVFFALLRANLVAVPINQRLTAFELNKIFSSCNPKVVITNRTFLSKIQDKDKSLLDNKLLILSDEGLSLLYRPKRFRPIQREFTTNNDDIASINYTYRGYGYPLGAMLTHGNYIHGATGYIRLVEPVLDQRFLLMMPISHIFTLMGCVVVPLLRGSTVVIVKSLVPSKIFKAIEGYKIDFLVGVPTIYQVLLRNYDSTKYDISSLKVGITGGAPMSLELYRQLKAKMNFQIRQGYGLTESMPVTCNPKSRIKPDSIGVPGHEVKVRIEDGEILIGGPTVMKGYYGLDKETEVVLKDGWVWTGDWGGMDKDGYLYFKGVKKDIVKVGGDAVDLKEVENVLLSHPDIVDVKLVTKPDPLWGEIVEAEINLNDTKDTSKKDIVSFCRDRLAVYKIPRKISKISP